MPTRRKMLSLATILLASPALSQEDHQENHQEKHHHHDFSEIDKWVAIFEEPGRETWQKPKEVVAWLNPVADGVIADVGAASGYFTRYFARALKSGWAIAVEIEPGFFKPIHELAQKEGLRNVLTQLCPSDTPGLPANSVDCIFLCDTMHHIEPRPKYYQEIRRALRPQGQLALVEYFHDRDIPFGPKKSERLDPRVLTQELETAGFKVRVNDQLLPYQYVLDARMID